MEPKTPAVDSKKPEALLYYYIYIFEFSSLWIIRVSAAMTVEKDVKLFDQKRSDSYQDSWDF
jgi:hypothetical protein